MLWFGNRLYWMAITYDVLRIRAAPGARHQNALMLHLESVVLSLPTW
jgi:hypothetical protein